MYIRIKDNLTKPSALYTRRNDKAGITVLYFFFLVVLLSITSIIDALSFTEMTPNSKTEFKQIMSEQLEIPCSIDGTLTCETDEVHKITYANINVFVDPTGEFAPSDLGVNVVLQEQNVYVYSANQTLLVLDYNNTDSMLPDWPTAWSSLDFDVESDEFWENIFLGLDGLIEDYRTFWVPISIVASMFAFAILLFTEVLIDTLILSLFRIGGLKYGQMFKLILNAATAYVLLSVILDLYNVNINYLLRSILQLIPVVYVLIAIRTQRGEKNV